jgi:NTE family protein
MKALYEEGLPRPSTYVGTSAGSLVASMLAIDFHTDYTKRKMMEILSPEINQIAYFSMIRSLVTKKPFMGLCKNNRFAEELEFLNQYSSFIRGNLGIITTDIDKGEQVIFSNKILDISKVDDDTAINYSINHKNFSKALLASCTLPAVFPPVPLYQRHLVDGGIVNNLGVDVAYALGADIVIAVDLGFSGNRSPHSALGVLNSSFDILMERAVDNSNSYKRITLNPKVFNISSVDFSNREYCFNVGYDYGKLVAKDVMKQLQQERKALAK